MRAKDADLYLPIKPSYFVDNSSIYMHGIRVNDEKFVMPYTVLGTTFDKLVINVKSDEYELNVTRKTFDDESRNKLYREITKAIFSDISTNTANALVDIERELLIKFVNEFL